MTQNEKDNSKSYSLPRSLSITNFAFFLNNRGLYRYRMQLFTQKTNNCSPTRVVTINSQDLFTICNYCKHFSFFILAYAFTLTFTFNCQLLLLWHVISLLLFTLSFAEMLLLWQVLVDLIGYFHAWFFLTFFKIKSSVIIKILTVFVICLTYFVFILFCFFLFGWLGDWMRLLNPQVLKLVPLTALLALIIFFFWLGSYWWGCFSFVCDFPMKFFKYLDFDSVAVKLIPPIYLMTSEDYVIFISIFPFEYPKNFIFGHEYQST